MITIEQAGRKRTYANGSASADVEALIRELATLRSQNRALRAHLEKRSRRSVIVERAILDGHQLVMMAFASEPTSRAAMAELGMSRWRWAWAAAFLRYAGIVDKTADWRAGLVFVVKHLDDCANLIEIATRELLAGKGGLQALRNHLRM